MSIDNRWARWIHASIADHFSTVAATLRDGLGLKLMVEGVDEREPAVMDTDHAELRINGPFVHKLSHNYFRLDVDVNILLTEKMGGSGEDAYELQQWVGAFQQASLGPIKVFRYGSDGDGSYFGCLVPRGRASVSKAHQFGQVGINYRVRQSAVDTRYSMDLSIES